MWRPEVRLRYGSSGATNPVFFMQVFSPDTQKYVNLTDQ